MTSVSRPSGGLNNLDASTQNANGVMCKYGSEDCFQSISKEHMDQIRNTMMRHEELFKEQVQALHQLYNIQKLAMQQIRQAIYSQAHMMVFRSQAISDLSSHIHRYDIKGKPIRSAGVTSQGYGSVPDVLPQNPIWMAKQFIDSGRQSSLTMSSTDFKTSPSVENKIRREIDLERPPEDYMEESEIQDETNGEISGHKALDTNTHFSESSLKTFQVSHVGSNFSSVLQTGCPNLDLVDVGPQIIELQHSKVNQKDCEQASETNIAEVNDKGVQNLNQASKNNLLKDFLCNHLSSVGNSTDNSRPSHNQYAENALWLYQGGSQLATQRLESTQSPEEAKHLLERTNNEVEKGNNSVSTEVCRVLDTDCLDGNENLNCVVHESNSAGCRGERDCIGILKIKSDLTFEANCGEPIQMGHVAVEGVQSENEAHTFTNVDIKPSNSSSISSHDASHMDHRDCSNGSPIIATGEPSTVVSESNAGTRNETAVEEACESIAAKILLSFAPGRSREDMKVEGYQTQILAESNGSNRDAAGHDRKWSLRARRSVNYSDGGFVDGTVKWTPLSGKRRRTLRKTR